jgi:hypothetical protein
MLFLSPCDLLAGRISRSLILIQALDFTHIYEIVCLAQKYHTLYINYIGVSPPKTLIFTKTLTMARGDLFGWC